MDVPVYERRESIPDLQYKLDCIMDRMCRVWDKCNLSCGDFEKMTQAYPGYTKRIVEIESLDPELLTDEVLAEYEKLHVNMFRHYGLKRMASK
jgi:hypothetical protein